MVNNNEIEYFLRGPNQDNDRRVSAEITKQPRTDFEGVFSGIGCFDGTFFLQVKPDSKPYHVPPRCVAFALPKFSKSS